MEEEGYRCVSPMESDNNITGSPGHSVARSDEDSTLEIPVIHLQIPKRILTCSFKLRAQHSTRPPN